MPGRDCRVPLRRFFDPNANGTWGYLIENCNYEGSGSFHVLYNFVLFPERFTGKEKGGGALNDMTTLMERNHEDNLAWCREHGRQGYRDWKELEGRHEGETLVLAGCGPSLTESLPTLYRRRSEFRLMCVNRSLRPFMDAEVKPDFYYFVERRGIPDWVHEVRWPSGATGDPFDLSGVTMIGTPQCDPRIVKRFDPDLAYWGYTDLGSMGHVPEIAALTKYDLKAATTIGNAPYLAWKMGFRKLILVGTDFGLECCLAKDRDPSGAPHVEPLRMYFDKDWNQTHYASDGNWPRKMMPVIGIGDRAVLTDPILAGHCTYMEAVLDVCHFDGNMTCINASTRGLLQFNVMGLDEALDFQPDAVPSETAGVA